jgi:hypothetical protein
MKYIFKKIIKYIFAKKSASFRRGYIHFHRGKYPKMSDNPFEEGKKKFYEWESGFLQAINDGISFSSKKKILKKIKK